ncbi:MAG: Ig-like domain-containing protein [Candidatus Marinimicrobia bacterium]|jgi:hypothetical protein|nr:Ig-like domain-containing protein [Candidatus Neomarinimicrobiota bacterium]MBT4733627.1 Ig-like domain-containing protein [Candidatus Neomarinimicrobiota bacterium]MBT5069816.1 Ig-like domain-containing protein [Candidatus Neomarinimicrobiota bacterium]MBT6471971.1 Ig-like domain-containing protein [Candidatus Neomarinimicrobiota bacterium]
MNKNKYISAIFLLGIIALSCTGDGYRLETIPDTSPPSTSIISPVTGQILSGETTIEVSATDNFEIDSVTYYINGKRFGVSESGINNIYSITWNTETSEYEEDEFHSLSVKATDNSNNYFRTTPILIKIDNIDNESPVGSIIYPYTGQIVDGIVNITLDVSDNDGIKSASYYINNNLRGFNTEPPFVYAWNTEVEDDDLDYSIYSIITDNNDNATIIGPISVTVNNYISADITFPVGAITFPPAGSVLSGVVDIQVTASDNRGVSDVEFYIDGTLESTDSNEPYSYEWDTNNASEDEEHIIAVIVSDHSDNRVSFTPIAVIVDNNDPVDGLPPVVTITQPAGGQSVFGSVSIQVLAVDETAMDRVEFLIDGIIEYSDDTEPFSYDWNSEPFTDDQDHIISATGYDVSGNSTPSQPITVFVNNFDNENPYGELLTPFPGQILSGTVTVEILATDNESVDFVSISIDGIEISQLTSYPYTYSWDTSNYSEDEYHVISVTVTDQSENIYFIPPITVFINNDPPVDVSPPHIIINNPLSGQVVSGIVSFTASAQDNIGIGQVEFFVDGSSIGILSESPFQLDWDTTILINNSQHTLGAEATDTSGNMTIAQPILVTVNNE